MLEGVQGSAVQCSLAVKGRANTYLRWSCSLDCRRLLQRSALHPVSAMLVMLSCYPVTMA